MCGLFFRRAEPIATEVISGQAQCDKDGIVHGYHRILAASARPLDARIGFADVQHRDHRRDHLGAVILRIMAP